MKVFLENWNHETAESSVDTLSYVYAHGTLFETAGYDIVNIYDDACFPYRTKHKQNVTAVMPDGSEVKSVLFYWIRKNLGYPAGLVVAADDKDAIVYAQEMYDQDAMLI